HLKMGTRDIQPGLNPKPGQRAACFHSMGLSFPDLNIEDLKALIEPLAIVDGVPVPFQDPDIALSPATVEA
ncbi:MAG: transglutaminase domain-containing protein, partial [Pseudomonadota bacterium]